MKRPSTISTILGAIAIALAVAGFSLSTVDAQTSQGSGSSPVQKDSGQGAFSASLGF